MTSCLSVSMYSNFLFIEVFYLLLTVLFVGTFVAYILSKKELLYNVDGSIKNQIFHEAKSR